MEIQLAMKFQATNLEIHIKYNFLLNTWALMEISRAGQANYDAAGCHKVCLLQSEQSWWLKKKGIIV